LPTRSPLAAELHGQVNKLKPKPTPKYIPFDLFFSLADYRSTRGHSLKLFLPADSRINARAYSFPVRIVTLWNRLPAATVLAQNLKQFKIAFRNTDLSYAILGKLSQFVHYSFCVLYCYHLCWPCLSGECLHWPFSSGIVFIWCILFLLFQAVD